MPDAPFWQLTAPAAWSTVELTLRADGSSVGRVASASPFPRHYLYDSDGRLTHKTALIRYQDWIRCSDLRDSPWGGGGEPVPVAPVRAAAERALADAILVSGEYRQHDLPQGALLSDRPIAATQVHLLLDGLLVIHIDQQPVLQVGPGAIFDPAMRTPYSKVHVTVQAKTSCRLAVLPRAQLDSQALLSVAAEQTSRQDALRPDREPPAGR